MIRVWAIGGYSEIGRNMTAIDIDGEVVILDMGIWVDRLVAHEEAEPMKMGAQKLIELEILPDDRLLFTAWGDKVKAIITTHAHLDHCAGIPKLANKYGVPIILPPYAAEVVERVAKDAGVSIRNRIIRLNPGSSYKISDNITVEFIYATHSTPQTVMIALHTKYGYIVYANDFKFDEYPTLGKRTDYQRLRKIGKEGCFLLISDSTRIDEERRTYSESLVREMLRDILWWTENEENAIFLTTFASHIARLKMVIELATQMGRTPVLLGRSMENYVKAAERIGIVKLTDKAKIYSHSDKINRLLKKVQKNREEYFVISTGCQGEPNSVLSRIARGVFDFHFLPDDQVIFSAKVIPTEIIMANRALLEATLKSKRVRIFKDVHVSGHAAREDHRDLLKMLNPTYYIPTHGGIKKIASAVDLARELGYFLGKDTFILQNGQRVELA